MYSRRFGRAKAGVSARSCARPMAGCAIESGLAAMNVPVFVLTGGDPIKRPDLFERIAHARHVGVRVSLTPSATPLASIYRDSPLFRSLRDTAQLEGKCGHCEFKEICGGSRARAYALTGDPMAEEPRCSYVPKGYVMPPPAVRTATKLHVLQGA